MTCPNCGQWLDTAGKYCPNCGWQRGLVWSIASTDTTSREQAKETILELLQQYPDLWGDIKQARMRGYADVADLYEEDEPCRNSQQNRRSRGCGRNGTCAPMGKLGTPEG